MQLTRRSINNDMTFGQGLANFAVDSESVAQNIVTRLRTFFGEWFLDDSFGIPYFDDLVEANIKAYIIETDGVDQLVAFSYSFDSKTRQGAVSATVTTIYGTVSDIQVTI